MGEKGGFVGVAAHRDGGEIGAVGFNEEAI